jgi:deoxyribonuclease V
MEKEELAKRFNLDLKKLETEQKKLAKNVSINDSIDFTIIDSIAGCDTLPIGNRIIAAMVILNEEMEVITQHYIIKKISVPYISGFRAYRELPALLECYNALREQPDVIFLPAHGIAHPCFFG